MRYSNDLIVNIKWFSTCGGYKSTGVLLYENSLKKFETVTCGLKKSRIRETFSYYDGLRRLGGNDVCRL